MEAWQKNVTQRTSVRHACHRIGSFWLSRRGDAGPAGVRDPRGRKEPLARAAFAGRFPLVEADATSKDALEQLGAREFRSAVVGVGSSLEAAVLITANLVDMGISSIWVKGDVLPARAYPAPRGRPPRGLPPTWMRARRTAHLVGGRMVDYIEMEKGRLFHHEAASTHGGARLFAGGA